MPSDLHARQGSLQVEMLAATRTYGLVPYQLPARLGARLREVAAGLAPLRGARPENQKGRLAMKPAAQRP